MVEVAGETFAIPLSEVQESIMLEPAEIHQVAAGEIINLRERLLPIVRLDRFFGFEKSIAREMEYIVIVGSGDKRSGIVVERLLGQQEIVIKAMQDYLGELPGISGGTVLGDGKISLVLDIASIIGKLARGGSDARD
jgi:two-component system chemotaxis sensor kinase CheA